MDIITVERKLLEKNDTIAAKLRSEFLEKKIFAVNILSSPGSGKTSLIEQISKHLNPDIKLSVIIGDVQTDNDARRIVKLGIPVIQIVTNGACHLEAGLIQDAFSRLENETDILIIENVGNLVCPAAYDLGEACKITVLSTAEGDDKPLKYPVVFRNSSVMIINKTDLLPYVNCKPEEMIGNARKINHDLKIFRTSCTTGEGITELCAWFESNIHK
jgi:hydrogenase nickel incorporation protein HypB